MAGKSSTQQAIAMRSRALLLNIQLRDNITQFIRQAECQLSFGRAIYCKRHCAATA